MLLCCEIFASVPNMKIIIFGRNGQVGRALTSLLCDQEVIALDRSDLDLQNSDQITSFIHSELPDWVINASAYTAVDKAEDDEILADQINHLAPKAMALACANVNSLFLHYSTDYVFDGSHDQAYKEDDEPCPQSAYGRTKLAGEQAVMAANPKSIILRTAWIYAKEGANFVNTMLRLGSEKDELNIVNDQYGSPTLAQDLATITIEIIDKVSDMTISQHAGVYHVTGAGYTSWYDFAKEIFLLTGNSKIYLHAVPTTSYPTPAKRPEFSVLSNQKLMDTFGLSLPAWQESLAKTLK